MTFTDHSDLSAEKLDEQSARTNFGALAIIFIVALGCFLPFPSNSPLAGTEAHRAITAHQMVQSGEWLVPRMFGRVYLAKPPLHYWLQATFETLSGKATPFIWRLPSAIEGTLLATLLGWLAGRWFGRIAGIVGGLGYVALITMWNQDRGADIDITNALVSTLAAICLLEPQFGTSKKRIRWIIIGGLGIGASFMTKGPCGLPPILGALIWIIIVRIREHRVSRLLRPEVWLPFIIGSSIFAIYAYATYHYIHAHHMAADLTGVQEGTEDLHPHDWSISRAIGIICLPLVMFAYALPISLALPFSLLREVQDGERDPIRRSRMLALAWTIIFSWVVCFLSGMHLPRYAFVTLPLMCPLAGAVAMCVPRLGPTFDWVIAAIGGLSAFMFGGAVLVTGGLLWRHPHLRPLVVVTGLVAITFTAIALRGVFRSKPNWRALYAIPIILICLAQNFGYVTNDDRLHRTSLTQAQMIRDITGPDAHLVTCMMVLDQPELFYYSGLPTVATDDDTLDWRKLTPGTWAVLEDPELDIWNREIPNRFKVVKDFVANRNKGYLVWYSGNV
jgi:4-amino-4-deoxy-L-arabinose transferase-like glycosyltransferase